MHVTATPRSSRLAAWRSLESAADHYASLGALALGVAGVLLTFILV